jgi:signal transduction histidine kinase/CheY-like chemotaxis protein
VGTSVDGANEGLYALLRALTVGLAASLALSALLAWRLSRRVLGPIDALMAGAAALGRGEPVRLPPLEIVELDDVGVALAAAAAERDRALHERERAATERERLIGQIADALRIAEEANRSKDQFLAVLGHELRNPLAPITNAMQLMQIKGDESTARERRIIERQLVHVTRLVDDLLDVSRITSGRLSIRRAPVRLAALLEQLVESVRPAVDGRALTLEIGAGTRDAWVSGDEVRLMQVFNNLLVNAIKFTPPAGSIRVTAVLSDSDVLVDVVDSGIGISADDIARIFEQFYQAPQQSDRSRGGLGLGLPIVTSLVEMHGGTVAVESAGPGQGSKFTVLLPVIEAPGSTMPAPLHASAVHSGRILVVDDNRDAADTCATLLEMSGYTVRVAYTPEAALQVLQQFRPDTAILDIGLPGMSGYALAGLMKAPPQSYCGKLVALTGYGQASDRAASSAAGFDAHLTKPVSPQELLDLVESLSSSAGNPS